VLGNSTKKITNINIVSCWAMIFLRKVSKIRIVKFELKIQRTKVCELQTLIVNEKGKNDHC
jgi:hypothetical protein